MKITDIVVGFVFSISMFFSVIGLASSHRFKNGWKYSALLQYVIAIMGVSVILMYVCYFIEVGR